MPKDAGTESLPHGAPSLTSWEDIVLTLMKATPDGSQELKPSALYHMIRKIEGRRPFPLVYQIAGILLVLWFLFPLLVVVLFTLAYMAVWSYITTKSIARSIVGSSFYNDLRCAGIGFLQMRQDIQLYIHIAQIPGAILLTAIIFVAFFFNTNPMFALIQNCWFLFLMGGFISFNQFGISKGLQKGFYEVPPPKDEKIDFREEVRALLRIFALLVALSLFIPILRLFTTWDRPLLSLLILIVYIKVVVITFFIYRKKTGHKPMDSYEATGGLPYDQFIALKFEEHIAHMEEHLSSR
ncbi:MAG: hypothetical protein JJU11_02110 [Candidatus Sumerlaeia bacterium]|nr:hypothetical protein [Candidatus Sumerlaeia bacterium]